MDGDGTRWGPRWTKDAQVSGSTYPEGRDGSPDTQPPIRSQVSSLLYHYPRFVSVPHGTPLLSVSCRDCPSTPQDPSGHTHDTPPMSHQDLPHDTPSDPSGPTPRVPPL